MNDENKRHYCASEPTDPSHLTNTTLNALFVPEGPSAPATSQVQKLADRYAQAQKDGSIAMLF